jgi:hypothetical protein
MVLYLQFYFEAGFLHCAPLLAFARKQRGFGRNDKEANGTSLEMTMGKSG